jgi:predicted nucleic acid-binding protein
MPEDMPPVLDTVVLRVMAFAHPDGLDILLIALGVSQARFPAEVYNQDEDTLPLTAHADTLSELARGLRYARRRAEALPAAQAGRYRAWLENARQLPPHLERGSLFVDPLEIEDLPRREALMRTFGIDLGEAACLVLAARSRAPALFLSADEAACRAAQAQDIPYLTLLDVLEAWVKQQRPSRLELEVLIRGVKGAKYGLSATFVQRLMSFL